MAAFGTYLITAVGLSIWPVHPAAGIVALSILAAFLAWWTTLPGAIGIGVLGWLFYSGFVTHTHGQLGVTGIADAIAAALLIACALVSAVVHLLLLRLAPRVRRRHPVITHRRTGDQPVTILIAEPGKARKLV